MRTKAQYDPNEVLRFYDPGTHERVVPMAPVLFYDDFIGPGSLIIPAAGSAESGVPWVKKIVGAAPPTVAGAADSGNGTMKCALTSANEKQDAALYWDDQRNFVLTQGCVFEARVRLLILPTLAAEAVWGLVSNWTDGPDAIAYSAFFTADGSGEIFCEVDDNATDSSASSGVTATAVQWKIYRIDFNDVTDIRFYIDGANVATGTTFPYAATGANATLQPYFATYKASGAGVGSLAVDYVRIWQKRS